MVNSPLPYSWASRPNFIMTRRQKLTLMLKTNFPKYLAEMAGTFFLVVFGCGAAVMNQITSGQITHLGVSLSFGLVVLAMVYSIGHISGAHLNPAVTLGFYFSGRFSASEIAPYIFAQLSGASIGSLVLRMVFGTQSGLGLTLPAGLWLQSFFLEILLTFLLMFVIMGVATDHRAQGVMAGVAIGATVFIAALVGGPLSGASMNPARSFGPALVTMNFSYHWIYWVAPLIGVLFGVLTYKVVECQRASAGSKAGCC